MFFYYCMKSLIVFYSRTGNTRKVASGLAYYLESDIEEIIPVKKYSGIIGYIKGGSDCLRKIKPKIKPLEHNISDYDIVIIGTPVWMGVSAPVRTFLSQNKIWKSVFFCTQGSNKLQRVFKDMRKMVKDDPLANLQISGKEIKNNSYMKKVKEFAEFVRMHA